MKIALTGTSSTGKSTLAKALLEDKRFRKYACKLIKVDARKIIESYKCKNIDDMTRKQLQEFEINYFKEKKALESKQYNFIAERSFVDIAAFWVVRDTYDLAIEIQNKLVEPCRVESRNYDLTVYLPFGVIPFEADGYRSVDLKFHSKIDNIISTYLKEWNINHITLGFADLDKRVDTVITTLLAYGHDCE